MDSQQSNIGQIVQRRYSRRAVLLGGGGAIAVGALMPLLAACGSSSNNDKTAAATSSGGSGASTTTSSGGSPASSASTAAPQSEGNPTPGGTLTLGYTEPPTMDPRVSGSTTAWLLFYNLFDQLVEQSEDQNSYVPGLSTKWEIATDGTSFTFTLNPDVKFHDGTPFNADAVKYTFDSIMDPALKSLTAIGFLGPYDSTTVVDDHTVKVAFKKAYAPFLNNLTQSVMSPVSPTAAKAEGPDGFGLKPVGTGPFKFKEWKQKISMTLEKNPDYNWPLGIYKHKGAAYLDAITLKFIVEPTVRAGTLENGESDVVFGVLPQDVKRLKADPKYQILLPSVPGSPQILPMNGVKSPTDDLKVRQAIIQAIDMKTVVDTLWFGTVKVAHGPLASTTWSYDPKVETYYPYDVKAAEKLLDDAGWVKGSGGMRAKGGETMTVVYITTTGTPGKAGELIQAYLTKVGMKVDLQELEYAATAADYLAGKHNIARIGNDATDPDILDLMYKTENIKGTNFNRTMKPDANLDKMLDDASAEMDPAKRKEDYVKIQEYIMDNALVIPLWEDTWFWGAAAKVKGIHLQPMGGIWFYDVWMQQ